MVSCLKGTLTVAAQDLARVRAALPEHVRLTLAEPGCRAFVVEDRNDGTFLVSEVFDDERAFAQHQARIKGTTWESVTASATREYRTWIE